MKTNPNEPAMPSGENYIRTDVLGQESRQSKGPLNPGLTKREEFAKAAMQGFCACPDAYNHTSESTIAAMAVAQADALIRALNTIPFEENPTHASS